MLIKPRLKNLAQGSLQSLLASLSVFSVLTTSARADRLYPSWFNEYDRTTTVSQMAKGVAVDPRGNVIITGVAKNPTNGHDRFYTAKYDALDGHKIWESFEGSGTSDFTAAAVAVDSQGDVIVTGSNNAGASIDYYTVKYNGANGNQVWAKTFNGGNSGEDRGVAVAVDGSNNVFVTGKSIGLTGGNFSGFDIVTLKYSAANGTLLKQHSFSTSSSRDDFPAAMKLDGSGNVVVVGTATTAAGKQFFVERLDTNLAPVWIKTFNTGGDGGATDVAIDNGGNPVAVGLFSQAGQRGYYTIALDKTDGSTIWVENSPPLSQNATGTATSVAIGPDNNPIVTGYLCNSFGTAFIRTIKYLGGGFFGGSSVLWAKDDFGYAVDNGLGNILSDTFGQRVVSDGGSNAIVLGEAENPDTDSDIYLVRYDGLTGAKTYASVFPGDQGSTDLGVGLAQDGNGGVAVVGTPFRIASGVTQGLQEIVTIKYDRLLLASGDALPDDPGVPANAVFSAGSAPALADSGAVAAKITLASGATKLGAIFTQGTAGGDVIPAVQKGAAPDIAGGFFSSFSDPVMSPDGHYAFAAKLTGVPAAKAAGVWSNLSGTLRNVLQVGVPVTELGNANVTSIMSLSMRNSRLVALVKVSGPATTNTALLGIDSAGAKTVLLRTGNTVTVGNKPMTTIKSITVLSPPPGQAGDGRWQGETGLVARAVLADKRTVLFRVSNAGVATALVASEGDASSLVNGTSYKAFGLPAIGGGGSQFVFGATLAPLTGSVTTANDAFLVYSSLGIAFTGFARENTAPNVPALSTLMYAGFSDPQVNANGKVSFVATLKGTGVKATNNKAILFGTPGSQLSVIARLGDNAPDSSGATLPSKNPVWSSFVSTVLPAGTSAQPIFVAKLSGSGVTAKNNVGVWAKDSTNTLRRLLRTGDKLGTQTVAKFTLLNALPTAFSAGRNFNATGSITAQVTFTDGKQALIKIGLP